MDWNSAFFAVLLRAQAAPEVAPAGVLRNPDFLTALAWRLQSGWTISPAYLVATDTAGTFAYQPQAEYLAALPDAGTATCVVRVEELTSGSLSVIMNNSTEASPTLDFGISEPGYYEMAFPLAPGDKTINFLSRSVNGLPLNAKIKFINLFVN